MKGMLERGIKRVLQAQGSACEKVCSRKKSVTHRDEDAPKIASQEGRGVWLTRCLSGQQSGSVPFPKRRGAMEQGREGQRKERK